MACNYPYKSSFKMFQTNENLRDIGMNVALALQSYTELEPFIENNQSFLVPSGGQQVLDLSAAPILFHLQSDMELMEYIKSCDNNVDNLDAKRVCTTALHISTSRLFLLSI